MNPLHNTNRLLSIRLSIYPNIYTRTSQQTVSPIQRVHVVLAVGAFFVSLAHRVHPHRVPHPHKLTVRARLRFPRGLFKMRSI